MHESCDRVGRRGQRFEPKAQKRQAASVRDTLAGTFVKFDTRARVEGHSNKSSRQPPRTISLRRPAAAHAAPCYRLTATQIKIFFRLKPRAAHAVALPPPG